MPNEVFVTVRNDWTLAEVKELFALPFMDLVFSAQSVHRRFQVPNTVQVSTLLSIKTGACPEDCAYCPQSVRFDTGLEAEELLELEEVAARARAAKESGATRFCMGAAYRSPKPKDLRKVLAMIREVKSLGMETCATLGMLAPEQARELKAAGLDYYNHNLDTSPQYYKKIISTRTYQDRLDTLKAVRDAYNAQAHLHAGTACHGNLPLAFGGVDFKTQDDAVTNKLNATPQLPLTNAEINAFCVHFALTPV